MSAMTKIPARSILERIEELTPEQRRVLSFRLRASSGSGPTRGLQPGGAQRLVAYARPAEPNAASIDDVRSFLKSRLPEFMQPAELLLMDEFPRTPNGKIDLRALPEAARLPTAEAGGPVAPRDDLERQLVEIWEELLGTQPIGIRDDFFELGGHSLLSMRFFIQLEKTLNKKLPLTMLFEEATIEYIAQKIREEGRDADWSALVPIQPHGNRPPFFCIHGQTGDVLWFRELGQQLAPEQPLYGLQSRGLDGEQEPISSIEEMAEFYIQVIRDVQPTGPYFLGGASLGGTIALEMARRLQTDGEEVALLVMFDHAAYNLDYTSTEPTPMVWVRIGWRVMRNFPRWLTALLNLSPQHIFGRVRRKARLAWKSISNPSSDSREAARLVEARDMLDYADELPEHRLRLIEANYDAIVNYRPERYPGRITLIQAESQPLFSQRDRDVGWKNLSDGGVVVSRLPGSHEEIFKMPHVQRMADLLKTCIDNAPRSPGG